MSYLSLKSGTDVRGRAVGENTALTPEICENCAAAFVRMLSGALDKPFHEIAVAVGRDSRVTGEMLLRAVVSGVRKMGARAVDFGMCTTPAMYMSLLEETAKPDGAVMVTASHHPWNMNGLKFFEATGGFTDARVRTLLEMAEREDVSELPIGGSEEKRDYLAVYQARLGDLIRARLDTDVAMPLLGLHVLVDAGNGAGGFYARMLEQLGAWVEGSQFLEPDGMFPNHIPNPENADAMASVAGAVVKFGADIGVIFDADCDRAAVVDAGGREINRNRLIALVSAILLDEKSGATIVTDSVTSTGLARFIAEWGGVHYRFKRGYQNVIQEAIRLNAAGIDCPLAIETSGHAAFRDNHFLDDGMYLVTLLLVKAMRLKQEGKTLGSLIEDLQEPVESLEVRLPILDADYHATGKAVVDHVLDRATFAEGCRVAPDNREGVRIAFDLQDGLDNGWFLLRLSVHDPVLPINAESDVKGGAKEILGKLLSILDGFPGIDTTPLREKYQQL